jgi:hypothetical protein
LGAALLLVTCGLFPHFRIAHIQSNPGCAGDKPTGFAEKIADFFALLSHGHFFVWLCVPAIGYARGRVRKYWNMSAGS